MRRVLLAGVCLVGMVVPVSAQMAVVDQTSIAMRAMEAARALEQALQQVALLRQQYMQLVQTYQAIAHLPDTILNQLGQDFNVAPLRTPLPGSDALSGVISGLGTVNGELATVINSFKGTNRIYTPYGSDFGSNALANNANSIAGVQASVSQLYASAVQHALALQAMEGQLAGAPDAKMVADIQARIALETAHLQSRQVQAQALNTWQSAQVRNSTQQREESRRCYIEAMLNGTDATQDTCARAASQGAVQLASAGTGGGSSVANSWSQYYGSSVGSGQCVAYVEAVTDVGLTRTWTQGSQVQGNTDLQPGTAIATFNAGGQYANATDGSSHAAIYLGQDAQGLHVADQWLGHAASERVIPWSGSNQANSGSAFYAISHAGS